MRVGVLTGGGDCPGLNAVIRAAVRVGAGRFGHEHVGIRRGWLGVLEQITMPLDAGAVGGILHRGGTILRSSRTNPFARDGGPEACVASMAAMGLDALIAIGGEDTLGVADRLHREHGVNVVGVPKTIDNDLSGTDYTFGFDTAVQIATEAIDRLHSTAESHDRVIVVEVMGRHAGWIAMHAGIAGGADVIVIPEQPMSVEQIVGHIRHRHERPGTDFSIVVVSEGVTVDDAAGEGDLDEFGHAKLAAVGIAERLAAEIGGATGFDTRPVVLGHVQRGGTPTAYDRILATRFGAHAAEMIAAGRFGRMAALRGDAIVDVPLAEAVGTLKIVPPERYAVAQTFFG